MDIFTRQKVLVRMVIFLIALNIGSIVFFVGSNFRNQNLEHTPHDHGPLLFPKNEAYRDMTIILKKELNLSAKQVKQFDLIRKRNFQKQVVVEGIIRFHKDEINKELFKLNTNNNTIELLAKQISENEYKMQLIRFKQAKELKAVCSKLQQKKMEELVIEIRDYFRPDNQFIRK